MSVRIQDTATGRYFRSPDAWVDAPGDATVFPTSAEAIRRVVELRLESIRIVLTDGMTSQETFVSPFGTTVYKDGNDASGKLPSEILSRPS